MNQIPLQPIEQISNTPADGMQTPSGGKGNKTLVIALLAIGLVAVIGMLGYIVVMSQTPDASSQIYTIQQPPTATPTPSEEVAVEEIDVASTEADLQDIEKNLQEL